MSGGAPGSAVVALLLGWALSAVSALAADPQFPPLTGRVVDDAALLSPAARDRLTLWLESFERQTRRQVVVATVKSLQGVAIEDFGYQLGRVWGIGEKGSNTGAILLVAPAEHAVRIEVGYGLEGELTDAISRTIIDQDILPAFRQGNYQQGILQGTDAILKTLGWTGDTGAAAAPPAGADTSQGSYLPLLFMAAIVLFAMLGHGTRGLWMIPLA